MWSWVTITLPSENDSKYVDIAKLLEPNDN